MDSTKARFPDLGAGAGAYESFYLKASHPSDRLGVWIRYTVHKGPGSGALGSLWFTLFDASADGPRASKVTLPDPRTGEEEWIGIGDSSFREGEARGSAVSERCDAAWRLRFRSAETPLTHLPYERLYSSRLPRTKTLSPVPAARFDGQLSVDGRTIAVEDWPGMVGHNWGTEHAERWIWLHGLGFEGQTDHTWLDLAIGRLRVGRVLTPWVANGALSLDGRRSRLGGLGRRVRVREGAGGCEFALPGEKLRLKGGVSAEPKDCVGWLYADPGGGEHRAINCSIADMTLRIERGAGSPLELRVAGGATYELGGPQGDPAVAIQPFPDP
ncbi:MAG: hypothetical protein ABR581_09645 [Thermoleophilaceae bacterium]